MFESEAERETREWREAAARRAARREATVEPEVAAWRAAQARRRESGWMQAAA